MNVRCCPHRPSTRCGLSSKESPDGAFISRTHGRGQSDHPRPALSSHPPPPRPLQRETGSRFGGAGLCPSADSPKEAPGWGCPRLGVPQACPQMCPLLRWAPALGPPAPRSIRLGAPSPSRLTPGPSARLTDFLPSVLPSAPLRRPLPRPLP